MLLLPVALGQVRVARVDFFGSGSNNTYDYYENIKVWYTKMLPNPGNLSDYFRVDRWNTTLGAWQSYLNYNITEKPNLTWAYMIYEPGDLDFTDNYSPTAAFRAGIWSFNSTSSSYIGYYLREFYVRRPMVSWSTNQYAYKYGSRVRFKFRGTNWRYWRDYYHNDLFYLNPAPYELVCELVIKSYPTLYELVPGQKMYLYNDTRSAENRDIVGSVEFNIPVPGSLGPHANLTIYTFKVIPGTTEINRVLLYSENITLVSKAIFGSVSDETAYFFGIPPSVMMMGLALCGVVIMTIFVGSVMRFSGPGYGILMLVGILFITALGWFDVWFATLSIVIIAGFMYFTSGEGMAGVAGGT